MLGPLNLKESNFTTMGSYNWMDHILWMSLYCFIFVWPRKVLAAQTPPNTTEIFISCSPEKLESPIASKFIVDGHINEGLVNYDTRLPYYEERRQVGTGEIYFRGLVMCYPRFQSMETESQCNTCLKTLRERVFEVCQNSVRANILAQDCHLQYSFDGNLECWLP